jgi:hypothetical protein
MSVSSPARQRLGRALNHVRDRREQRADRAILRAELVNFRTTAEVSELSAIAARNSDVDTSTLRRVISEQLSR